MASVDSQDNDKVSTLMPEHLLIIISSAVSPASGTSAYNPIFRQPQFKDILHWRLSCLSGSDEHHLSIIASHIVWQKITLLLLLERRGCE